MNWIAVLQNLYGEFPKNGGPLGSFSRIEKILRQKMGLTRAVFALRQEKHLRTIAGKNPLGPLMEKKVAAHFKRSPRPWLLPPGDRSGWLGFWPVVVGQEWVGCFGLGHKMTPSGFSAEEGKMMELLADRSALYLEERRFWDYLESADRQSAQGFRSAATLHEIRAPLTALSALVQLLPEKKDDTDFMTYFQPVMLREVRRLTEMTAVPHLCGKEKARVDFSGVVNQAAGLMGPLFKIQKVQLRVKNRPGVFLRGYDYQMESLVLNLLKNALEAVSPGGKVELSADVRSGGNRIELRVRDNGRGISRENLKKIFGAYFSTKNRGTGLGLAICQRVVENHGGTIKASSSARGTEFQILLPRVSSTPD